MSEQEQNPRPACNVCESNEYTLSFAYGEDVIICDSCIEMFHQALLEERKNHPEDYTEMSTEPCKTPQELKAFLDDYIIKQDEAKKSMAIALYNHHKRLNSDSDVEISKSNILMLGPTGTGKTLIAETLAKALNVPFASGDATSLTESGYVGEDVENLLRTLLANANNNVEMAERGIVYIDEIDKLARAGENMSTTAQPGKDGVQQSLLKMIEGTVVEVPLAGQRKHPHAETVPVNTKNILFICGGAFVGLTGEDNQKRSIGFTSTEEISGEKKEITHEDLKKFGMIPEFLGRMPVLAVLENLDRASLIKILREPKNSLIKQYVELFKIDDINLIFSDEALEAIADQALETKIGARGLRSIMEKVLKEHMFEAPSNPDVKDITITKAYVLERLKKSPPVITKIAV